MVCKGSGYNTMCREGMCREGSPEGDAPTATHEVFICKCCTIAIFPIGAATVQLE